MQKYLILDIGNSMIDAYYQASSSEFFFTVEKTSDSATALMKYLFSIDENFSEGLSVFLSSVNRPAEKNIIDKFVESKIAVYPLTSALMEKYTAKNHFIISNTPILGSDLFADIVGCRVNNSNPELIADFGTATKLLLVDKNKVFKGAAIFPGIYSCANLLTAKTDLLDFVQVKMPEAFLSLASDEAIKAGAVFGTAFMLQGYYQFFMQQSDFANLQMVITGGGGSLMVQALDKIKFSKPYIYDRFRIIRGIINAFDFSSELRGGMIYASK